MSVDFGDMFAGRHALVTGGLGFIGSHLARRLVDLGADVTIIDNLDPLTGANEFNIAEIRHRVQLVISSVDDETKSAPLLGEQDFLFSLAAYTSHLGSMEVPLKDVEINAVAQLTVLEWCRKLNPGIRIVFGGTRQVYGRPRYLPVDETHPIAPVDYNGVSKLAGELYHVVSHQVHGLWTTVVRMTNVYGPHMRIKDARQTFVGWWIHQLLNGRDLPIFGDGRQIRDLNYVDDVVDALLLCASQPEASGKVYNLGGDPVPLLELASLILELNGGGAYQLEPFPAERQSIDIGSYYGDYTAIRNDLGWQPRVSLREGLARTLAFYSRNQARYL